MLFLCRWDTEANMSVCVQQWRKELHTHTQRRRGKHVANSDLQQEKYHYFSLSYQISLVINSHLLDLLIWAPGHSTLNMPVIDLRPWSSVKHVAALNQGSQSETTSSHSLGMKMDSAALSMPGFAELCQSFSVLMGFLWWGRCGEQQGQFPLL